MGKRFPLTDRDELGRKRCSHCKAWKHEGDFGSNKSMPDDLSNLCKDCSWSANMYRKYRITGEQYESLLETQGGVCAICGSPPESNKMLAVDHDHNCCPGSKSCGQCIRGLLCLRCNVSLGNFRDDLGLLRNAISYLETYLD